MSQPLVTVIIPCYDRPLFLRERSIPSVLAQEYPHWELLVVGDGPRDGALREAAESFGDPRIRYSEIPRPDYSALSREQLWHAAGAAARNHGLAAARGEIIAPLDDDDELLPNHLADNVRALSSGQFDFAYGSVVVRDLETGREYLDYFPWDEEGTRQLFLCRNIMFHSSVCYSGRFAHLRYPTDGSVPADYGLWLRIAEAGGRFTGIAAPQSIYYGDNLSQTLRVSVPSLPPFEDVAPSLRQIFDSRMLSNSGPVSRDLERAVAEAVGVPHAVSAPSGDVALLLAFRALAEVCGPRRQVVMPSYTHPSTANAAVWNGFEPVFCDVDPRTLCLAPELVEPALGGEVAAIVAVHAHGNPCDMPALEQLAARHGVFLIADAAAALGASLDGRPIGGFGDMEVFSFSGTKVLTAGEGGMVCCRDDRLAALLRRGGRYGIDTDYWCEGPGVNGKLAEIPAALALAGLPLLDGWLARRRQAAERYRAALAGLPGLAVQETVAPGAVASCKDLPLILPSAEEARDLARSLRAYRIETRPYYRPLHRMPAFRRFPSAGLAATERLADAVLCVPLYNQIRDEVLELVIAGVREARERRA
jgi:dTDP-4-amino-4,6-dideoxygalactose transaminase